MYTCPPPRIVTSIVHNSRLGMKSIVVAFGNVTAATRRRQSRFAASVMNISAGVVEMSTGTNVG